MAKKSKNNNGAGKANATPESGNKTVPATRVTDNDSMLFRDAVGDVKPVTTGNRREPEKNTKSPTTPMKQADDKAVMRELLEDFKDTDLLETGEHLAWCAPGIQRSELRKLKSGRYAIQAEIDLHGFTRAEAKAELAGFLHHVETQGHRCVRIIHGRGRKNPERTPVLKRAVDNWLQHHKRVLAYCSARENDGGTGAVYVLLRRTN